MKDYSWGPGWGLEIVESAHTNELIGEYVGEIISETEYNSREPLAHYLGRNYMFSIDNNRSIDAAAASNEMRFVNHARGKAENCKADVRFVGGEPRIAFFAKRAIKAGEELFFDYGVQFFPDADADQVQEVSSRVGSTDTNSGNNSDQLSEERARSSTNQRTTASRQSTIGATTSGASGSRSYREIHDSAGTSIAPIRPKATKSTLRGAPLRGAMKRASETEED